jgi:hypothetical protein
MGSEFGLVASLSESFDRIAPCPICGDKPMAMTPRIEAGQEVPLGPVVTFKAGDRLVGFTLQPCGHNVELVEWSVEHGYRFEAVEA